MSRVLFIYWADSKLRSATSTGLKLRISSYQYRRLALKAPFGKSRSLILVTLALLFGQMDKGGAAAWERRGMLKCSVCKGQTRSLSSTCGARNRPNKILFDYWSNCFARGSAF